MASATTSTTTSSSSPGATSRWGVSGTYASHPSGPPDPAGCATSTDTCTRRGRRLPLVLRFSLLSPLNLWVVSVGLPVPPSISSSIDPWVGLGPPVPRDFDRRTVDRNVGTRLRISGGQEGSGQYQGGRDGLWVPSPVWSECGENHSLTGSENRAGGFLNGSRD